MTHGPISTLDLIRTVYASRNALNCARLLIRNAQRAKQRGNALVCRGVLKLARELIADARRIYADAMQQLAQRRQLSHHAEQRDTLGRFRATIRFELSGLTIWQSARTYGKRQSAQHAASRYVFRLRLAAIA